MEINKVRDHANINTSYEVDELLVAILTMLRDIFLIRTRLSVDMHIDLWAKMLDERKGQRTCRYERCRPPIKERVCVSRYVSVYALKRESAKIFFKYCCK